jgi:hypothetical protein
LEAAIDSLDVVATLSGVGPNDWDAASCKANLKQIARLATTPYCSPSSCAPLGFCDVDCSTSREACGLLASYSVLEQVLQGGVYHSILSGMVGSALVPCTVELLSHVTGGGDDSKICDSASSTFDNMAFGAMPYVDCLPLSRVSDPNDLLRGPFAPPDGSCALSAWDIHEAELAAVAAHNEALKINATAASVGSVEEADAPSYPWWRSVALPVLPLLQAICIFAGRFYIKKGDREDTGNMAAVTPVRRERKANIPEENSEVGANAAQAQGKKVVGKLARSLRPLATVAAPTRRLLARSPAPSPAFWRRCRLLARSSALLMHFVHASAVTHSFGLRLAHLSGT